MNDPAAVWVKRTPKQRAQAAARFDREAAQVVAAHKAQQDAEARAKAVAKAVRTIELLGIALLTGEVRPSRRPLTKEERKVCAESVKDAWKYLRRVDPDFVTALS